MNTLNKYTIEQICKYLEPKNILNLSLSNTYICDIIHNELYKINYDVSNRKFNKINNKCKLFLNINTFNIIKNTVSYTLTSLSISNISISECYITQLYNLKKIILKNVIIDSELPQSLISCIMINVDIKVNDVIKNLYNLKSLGITIKKNLISEFPDSLHTLSIIESNYTKINITNITNKINVYLMFNKKLKKIELPNKSNLTIISCDKLKEIHTNDYTFINKFSLKKIKNIELYHKYLLKQNFY